MDDTAFIAAADAKYTAASKAHTAAQLAYRARKIDDAEFLAARAGFHTALEELELAMTLVTGPASCPIN